MHIYRPIKGQSQQAPAFPSRPSILLHFCLSCLRLEIPPSWLTRRPFMLLVFHAAATPASLLRLQLLPLIHSTGRGEGGGRDADSPPSSV